MRMFETLEKIVAGNGTLEDLDFLEDLGKKVKAGALCGLGQTAPNPVLATLRYYRNEYIDHVEKKTCTALQCNNLVKLKINMDKCVKCKLCIKSCPVEAITPEFEILSDKCSRCNSCLDACPKKAITRIPREDN
jgi:ferredoxin